MIVLDSVKRVNIVIVVGPMNRFDSTNTSSFVLVVIAEFANNIYPVTFDGPTILFKVLMVFVSAILFLILKRTFCYCLQPFLGM